MSTTTIRLSEELKDQVANAAMRTGVSTHSFIVTAIEEKAAQEDKQHAFSALAKRREQKVASTGKTIAWSDMRAFLQTRATGKKALTPKSKKISA
jgi:predicted transcriptional regulator